MLDDQTTRPAAAPFTGETIRRGLDQLARVLDRDLSDPSDAALAHAKLDELQAAFDDVAPSLAEIARYLDVARALAKLPNLDELAEMPPGTVLRVQPLGRMRNGEPLPATVATRLADGVDAGASDPRQRWSIALPGTQLLTWTQLCAGADVLGELAPAPTPMQTLAENLRRMTTPAGVGWQNRERPHAQLDAPTSPAPDVDLTPRRPAGPLDDAAEAAAGELGDPTGVHRVVTADDQRVRDLNEPAAHPTLDDVAAAAGGPDGDR